MKKAENTGNYIDISFSNKRNNVFLLLLYKSYYLNLVTFAVAPLAGAWVEIITTGATIVVSSGSLPSRERGLKFTTSSDVTAVSIVAPLAGAWVEMASASERSKSKKGRSPRGSVG